MEIKTTKLYTRNNIIYIDAHLSEIGRVRFSTKLANTQENAAKVLLSIKDYVFKFLRGEEEAKAQKHTMGAICERFIKLECLHLKSGTLHKYQVNARELASVFGDKDVRLIKQSEIAAYITSVSQAYKANFLNRIVRFMRDEGITALKPMRVRKSKTYKSESVLPLSLEEVKLMLDSAKGEFESFLRVAFFTGMRSGELYALEWADIDFKNNKIRVSKSLNDKTRQVESTKTHTTRYIDMLPIVRQALEKMYETQKEGRIFANATAKRFRAKWHKLLEKLGLQKRALYQTRHSFATLMLVNNEEPLWVSAMLGHKSLSTTFDHYVKYIPQKKVRAGFTNALLGGE